jgi:drug/metabolite transporter (DMT)-like permease
MPLIIAYIGVVLIWSTTPIAIQFSLDSLDFFTGVSLRMWISALLSLPLLALLRQPLVLNAQALRSYVAGSVGVYGAMMAVYWGTAYIPSGLISVIYGLSPMLSGAIAWFWLGERELTPARIIALSVALAGLTLVVTGRLSVDATSWRGITGTLLSVFFFALSAVWVKQVGAGLHPMVQTSGTLWVSSVAYVATIPLFGVHLPEQWSVTSAAALSYLVAFGSLLGFLLYFYVLSNLPASRVTLITLVAPVLAVFWGFWLKGERLSLASVIGVMGLMSGLALYQWHKGLDRLFSRVRAVKIPTES